MTSNFAIGNTASIAAASNVSPSGDIAGVLNRTALNGGPPVLGSRQLMAGAIRQRPASPQAIMKGWHKALKPVARDAAKPAGFGTPLVIPVTYSSRNTPASALFNKGGSTLKVPGMPELMGPIDNKTLAALDRALTPQVARAFERLSDGGKITAFTFLCAGLEAMRLPQGSAGRIDPKEMGMVLETALQYGRQTPTVLGRSANPGNGATTSQGVPRATPDQVPTSKGAQPPMPGSTPTSKPVPPAQSGLSSPPGLQDFERRPGESMSDYLARQKVPQSLTPQQQRSADKHQLRMSATPPRPGPSPRRPLDAVSLALKMRIFGDSASAIANPRTYDTFLNLLDQQRVTDVVRIGNTNATGFIAETLAGRTQEFRDAGVHSLTREFGGHLSPQMATASGGMNGGMAHEAHTAFGAVSKLGEVHASSRAFNNSTQSWASRGLLPGQGGQTVAQFWKPDFPLDWVNADQALTSLADAGPQMTVQTFADSTIERLRNTGFIPKGSALAARLERLEMAIAKREMLLTKLNTADYAQAPALRGQLRAAITNVRQGLDDFANRATQSRSELLMQSLGTPKTTYELTIRHATAARYMQSIEGQRDAVFSAPKFKALMAEVKAEAGPEAEVSLRWHRALIETYGANAAFQGAMRNSLPMRQAWAAYKAQYGL